MYILDMILLVESAGLSILAHRYFAGIEATNLRLFVDLNQQSANQPDDRGDIRADLDYLRLAHGYRESAVCVFFGRPNTWFLKTS